MNFWVVIDDRQTGLKGRLAALALQRAAEARGDTLAFEIQGRDGVQTPLAGRPTAGDTLVLVGQGEAPLAFRGLTQVTVTLEEALEDAAAVLDRQAGAVDVDKSAGPRKIVAITSCPTGIAHTFMAAEGLEQAAKALGHAIRVETQGSVGAGTPLTAQEIAEADLVIIAADREVDRGRFAGKRLFAAGTNDAITQGKTFMERAFREAKVQSGVAPGLAQSAGASAGTEKRAGPYKHLMTGVSFMLPFVVAGGLCIALSFAFGGIHQEGVLAQFLGNLGGAGGFALMVPILAGYIAFSIADRPGIAPGMIGGILCNQLNTGFLGGIAAGFLAGYAVNLLNKYIKLNKNLEGLKPVLILPLLGTLVTGAVMVFVIGGPIAALNAFLTRALLGMSDMSSLVLGLILGAMMAVDMGGPVNKAAYAFSTGMLGSGIYGPMAATMAAGMTPPIAAAIATRFFKGKFVTAERESWAATLVLGLAFISEGAIPFAARDPIRVLVSFIAGSALTGALSMVFGINLMAPHGGIFVLAIPGAVSNVALYALAIAAGAALSTVLLGVLKKPAGAE